jgi:hypothetical protein
LLIIILPKVNAHKNSNDILHRNRKKQFTKLLPKVNAHKNSNDILHRNRKKQSKIHMEVQKTPNSHSNP